MLKNYLKVAWRSLKRDKLISAINITGLAVGFACAALMLLYVDHEFSFDRYHAKKDRIYRLVTGLQGASYEAIAKVPGPWGILAANELPEVEQVTRFVLYGSSLVSRGANRFYEDEGVYADSSLFRVFSFPLLSGDPETALSKPNSVVITESLAARYFPDEEPLGQLLTFDNDNRYAATGVIADVPANSHFTFTFAVSMSNYGNARRDEWYWLQYYTYLLLAENSSPQAFSEKFSSLLTNHLEPEEASRYSPFLQPLTDIHLRSNLFREMASNSDIVYVYLFSAIAFFILLIAVINFMNLATARATIRSKEVSVRKIIGADRRQLVRQFLGEALLSSTIAFLLSLMLIELFLPVFNSLAGREMTLNYFDNSRFLISFVGLSLLVGLVAGSYPAFVLSAFKPVQSLKSHNSRLSGSSLRRMLVILQFAITAVLIVATGLVYNQLQFIQKKRLGFNPEQLITFRIQSNEMRLQHEAVKQALLQNPHVISASVSGNLPGGRDWGIPSRAEGVPDDEMPALRVLAVDHHFTSTLGMELKMGQSFSQVDPSLAAGAFMINEEAARQLGWQNPLDHRMAMPTIGREYAPVIGVLKDFHFRSMREKIGPILLFIPPPDWFSIVTVRVSPENISAAIDHLRATWDRFDAVYPFDYSFFDDDFAQLHAAEQKMAQLLTYVAVLAILIACLGVFGLAAFTAEQRNKEIGIRRVLGASTANIMALMTGEFVKLVLLSNLIAWPIAWFVMDSWLQGFAYRVELSVSTFLLVAAVTLLIALLTVSRQAIKAALSNPVEALRYGSQ